MLVVSLLALVLAVLVFRWIARGAGDQRGGVQALATMEAGR